MEYYSEDSNTFFQAGVNSRFEQVILSSQTKNIPAHQKDQHSKACSKNYNWKSMNMRIQSFFSGKY